MRRTTTLWCSLILLVGCGGDGSGEISSPAPGPEERAGAATSRVDSSCLADYADRLCELLSPETLRAAVPEAPQEVERTSTDGAHAACAYGWPSDRTRTVQVAGRTMEAPVDNTVAVAWLQVLDGPDPVESFRRSRLPTAEEREAGRRMFEDELEERADEEGLSADETARGAEFADELATSPGPQPVEGLGTMAVWEDAESEPNLWVLHGDVEFRVTAAVSDDPERNRAAAIAVAEELIAVCDGEGPTAR